MASEIKPPLTDSTTEHSKPTFHPGIFYPAARGVVFDFGGVIYDDTAWRVCLGQVLAKLKIPGDHDQLFQAWRREYAVRVFRGEADFRWAFGAFFTSLDLPGPLVEEVEAACRGARRRLLESIRPVPGVKRTLIRLREAGLAVGLLSDSEQKGREIRRRLARFGLDRLFDVVVSSRDTGETKPSPAGYREAVARMELAAEEVVFVGHDPNELSGAASVGMQTAAVSHPHGTSADAHLSSIEAILDLISAGLPIAAAS